MAEITPFLGITAFEGMFRPLSETERTLATKLLAAASQWIRDRKPSLLVGDAMAELVVFEVTAAVFPPEAPIPGVSLRGHTQYSFQTDDRLESGTLVDVAGLLDFTDHHKQLLGLSITAEPSYGGFGEW